LIFLAARIDSCVERRAGLAEFEAARSRLLPPDESASAKAGPSGSVDTSLWAEGRIRAYEESLEMDLGRTIAILRIPKIRLEVPVLEGTDEVTLNRGLGRIPGTARPGAEGNLGLAGHRDGFFRGLKDVAPGDRIELETLSGLQSYEIDEILIVEPEDVHVLDPTPEPSLTLVTCYPFYFVGSAPERYIVRASLSSPPA
jgi:sortase A